MSVTLKITGLSAIARKLATLEPRIARKAQRTALREAARPIQKKAIENAPRLSGRLASAIKIRAGKRQRGKKQISIDVVVGKKWFKGDEFYAAFQEFGWKSGRRKGGSGDRKAIPGKHYIERAYDSEKNGALNTLIASLGRVVNEEASRG